MSRLRLPSKDESAKIKKELENLMKGSREEYRNASVSEREAFQADLGLQPKVIPENILRKGKAVLDVSGSQRKVSSRKNNGKTSLARKSGPAFSSFSERNDSLYGDLSCDESSEEQECASLDVMMKGQSVFKAERDQLAEENIQKDSSKVFQEIGDLIGEYLSSGTMDNRKPAILTASNTTKGISLATRKPKPKKYEPPKKLIPKKKREIPIIEAKSNDGVSKLAGSAVESQSSAINISVERNLTFDELDEKFYEILRHKLNVNIRKGAAGAARSSGTGNLDRSRSQSVEAQGTVKVHVQKEEDMETENQAAGNLESNQNAEVDATYDEYQTQLREGETSKRDDKQPSESSQFTREKEKQMPVKSHEHVLIPTAAGYSGISLSPIVKDESECQLGAYANHFADKEAALKALSLPVRVANADIVNIAGEKASATEKKYTLPPNSTAFVSKDALHMIARERKQSFLTSWTKSKPAKPNSTEVLPQSTIHHFCTSVPAIQLPSHMRSISRRQHARDKFAVLNLSSEDKSISNLEEAHLPIPIQARLNADIEPRVLTMVKEKNKPSDEEKRLADLATKIIDEALRQTDKSTGDRTFMKLQNIVDQVFDENDEPILQISGRKAEIKCDETRLYWAPAPPKFDLPPDIVKEQLIPKYQGVSDGSEQDLDLNDETYAESEDESSSDDDIEQEDILRFRERIIRRTHGSAPIERKKASDEQMRRVESEDETENVKESPEETESSLNASRELQSVSEMRQLMAKLREEKLKKEEEVVPEETASSHFVLDFPKRRTVSQPLLIVSDATMPKFDSGYDVAAEELEFQSQMILEMRENLLKQASKTEEDASGQIQSCDKTDTGMKSDEKIDDTVTESNFTYDAYNGSIKYQSDVSSVLDAKSSVTYGSRRDSKSTITYGSKGNTRGSIRPKRLSTKLSRKLKPRLPRITSPDPDLQRRILELLGTPVRKIERSVSLEHIRPKSPPRSQSCLQHRKSMTNMPDFDEAIGHKFNQEDGNMLFWIKDEYWYRWIDEIYPPSVQSEQQELSTPHPESETGFDDDILQHIDIIEPREKNDIYQLLLNEIDSMTLLIESTEASETLAIHLCRRGACYRKIGDLKRAKEDLERSVELEPKLIDAHWHRHFLYLLQGDSKKALADLDYVLNHNVKHFGAYRSRAELYSKRGDLTAAIWNYSEAIKLKPDNPDVYYARAYLFQQRGDTLLALGDFKVATTLQPIRTEGIRNIGIYHFENRFWTASINDFTALLEQEPHNEEAYLYRGQAYANLTQYQEALSDIATAIHLNPKNGFAFYLRGCLLRKLYPKQALQDLSTSILLDHSLANIYAFLHRGILYTEMKRWEEAMSDFEETLKLAPDMPAAHVNLGLIYMSKLKNPHLGMRKFNAAIRVDPTYVRALVCRAEANQLLHSTRESIVDYTRAIHLRPDVTEYRMARGKLLMQIGKFDLASYHIKQCAAMGKENAKSTTRQAAVLSFLKNHKQAIKILEKSVKTKLVPHLHILLGKTKMKAKMFQEAIESFHTVLKLMKPWNEDSFLPPAAAEVFYLIGMAYTELVNHSSALDAFSSALKINPEYPEAYYQRGLSKMRLRYAKAVHDFNRALAYNPKFFQAYLSRAEYYGMKGRYSKAILNCNEAIRLKPNSIRGYLSRGALKYYIQAYKFAVKDLSQAIAIDANCNLAYFNRAVCYQEMKHYQKALKDYGIVLLIEKKENVKVLQNRGLLYLETGEFENALRDFLAASELEPRNPRLHHTLGMCYHRLGLIDKSVKYFSNALKIDTFFVEALLGRGNAIMDYGTADSNTIARRDFLRALRLNPLCLAARVNLAYSLQVQGRFKAAWIQFAKCIDIDEKFKSAYEGRAIVNLQMGNTFGAFVDINQALKIEATAEFLTNRGVINQFMGDIVNAMRDYQSAIKKDPSYSLAYYNAANLYFGHRQFQQALDYYNRAISWNQNDESAFINRGITRVLMRNFDGALEDFNRAAELSPFAAHLYFNRGNLNAFMGRYEYAQADYSKALELQPGDALVYKRRADVRSKLSLKDEALKDYQQAIFIQTQRIKVT